MASRSRLRCSRTACSVGSAGLARDDSLRRPGCPSAWAASPAPRSCPPARSLIIKSGGVDVHATVFATEIDLRRRCLPALTCCPAHCRPCGGESIATLLTGSRQRVIEPGGAGTGCLLGRCGRGEHRRQLCQSADIFRRGFQRHPLEQIGGENVRSQQRLEHKHACQRRRRKTCSSVASPAGFQVLSGYTLRRRAGRRDGQQWETGAIENRGVASRALVLAGGINSSTRGGKALGTIVGSGGTQASRCEEVSPAVRRSWAGSEFVAGFRPRAHERD